MGCVSDVQVVTVIKDTFHQSHCGTLIIAAILVTVCGCDKIAGGSLLVTACSKFQSSFM